MYDIAILWDWFAFAVRWLHVITAIAWIGSSFYFIALDLGLHRDRNLKSGADFIPVLYVHDISISVRLRTVQFNFNPYVRKNKPITPENAKSLGSSPQHTRIVHIGSLSAYTSRRAS